MAVVEREAVPAPADQTIADLRHRIGKLEQTLCEQQGRLEAATLDRDAAFEQHAATAEILQVINNAAGNPDPVFAKILEQATHLCEADFGIFLTFDGERFHTVALHNAPEPYAEFMRRNPPQPGPTSAIGRILRGEPVVRIDDVTQERAFHVGDPRRRALAELGRARSYVAVGLYKDNRLLGTLAAYRQEVKPFTAKQIALLQGFAAQAVIALDNARLLAETREALEQQAAAAEVLQIIKNAAGNLAPVFEALLDKALRVCEAAFGTLWTYDGEHMRASACRGAPPQYLEFLGRRPHRPSPIAHQGLLSGDAVAHIADIRATEAYRGGHPLPRAVADLGGVRTLLAAPLKTDAGLIGVLSIYRQEIRPFSDRQIALLRSFADQAVIAMENARLVGELRERSEELTRREAALRASEERYALAMSAINEGVYEWDVATGEMYYSPRVCDLVGLRPSELRTMTDWTDRIHSDDKEAFSKAIIAHFKGETERVAIEYRYRYADGTWHWARQHGIALKNKKGRVYRVVGSTGDITDRKLAEQALREALAQQTATAEVLQVINASPGDLTPVFEAILDKAKRVCGVDHAALEFYDGERMYAVAVHGASDEFAALLRHGYPAADSPASRALLQGERFSQIIDAAQIDNVTFRTAAAVDGVRTVLFVPLRREDALLGMIASARREVRPFSDKEISLLENFAAQAVIAMHNARLLDQIRQRQAELRVTFDNMGDGVAMFDAELRLAAWNRNFQQILDLPDALLAEPPDYNRYIRYLAARGEFGRDDIAAELTRRLEDTARELRVERTRPDGRVIEVRRNAVPGGGFVLIYSDVTERKRAEAEIRSARDAAEHALAELKTAQASLIHAEKMASLGQLTAGIAHEIKNPLNFVNNFAGLSIELLQDLREIAGPGLAALDASTRDEADETIALLSGNLDKIAEHGRRADGIVQSMLTHSRASSGERRPVDLNALVDEALNLAYHGARAQDQGFSVMIERDFAPDAAAIELVPQDIMRVFLNLFGNGLYAAQQRGTRAADADFAPRLRVTTRDLSDVVEVRVYDNGIGIRSEHRDRLFQPFFTTKPTGEGTGLGLSISYDIVTHQHQGTIEVQSIPGEFTEFTVRLPRAVH
jgi:two-component system, NtrC family, sensor kinase